MITSEQLALLHNLVNNGGRIVGVADLSPEELRLADDEKRIAVGHGFGIAWIPNPPKATPEVRMVEVYDVAAEACATWGPTAQATMIVEEVGEFLTAFARLSRDRATREQVIEEAADVIVVLGSALVLVGGKGNETLALLAEAVEGKVARLRERLARANS